MKKLVIALFLGLMGSIVSAQDGIQFFEGTWAEILAKAKSENRIIFMDAYTTWCGPCKFMSANIFPNEEVGKYYNEKFVNVKIDMEKGEGVALARLYNVRAYPTLLYINWKGEVVHRAVGGRQVEGFIDLGSVALDNTRNFRSVEQAYLSNPGDVNNLIAYATALKAGYDRSYTQLISTYLADKPMEILLSETGWQIISEFVEDPDSREFEYFLMMRQSFEKMVGKEEVDIKLAGVTETMIGQAVRKNTREAIDEVQKRIRQIHPNDPSYYLAVSEVQFARRNSDWPKYATEALKLIKPGMDTRLLNNYAWDFYQHIDNQAQLQAMTKHVAAALKTSDEYALRDTYAALLFKTKNHKAALKEARAAIETAKKEGVPFEETLELIEEIEKAGRK
jgi:thiol-disulfide isomerase/thioredoxin